MPNLEQMLEKIRSIKWGSPRGRLWRRLSVSLLILLLLAGLTPQGLKGIGYWLMVKDPLEHAQAIVVLGGHVPFRAMEAATLYHQGWAPEIWLTRGAQQAEGLALARLGIQTVGEGTYNRQVLERLGVPPGAIRLLSERVRNTAEEIQLIARELERVGGRRLILITSKPHGRRVQATWRALVGKSAYAMTRYPMEDPYDPSRWWANTRDALAVSREVFGLMNAWMGFPIQPDRKLVAQGDLKKRESVSSFFP